MDAARVLINRDAWDLAIYLHAVTNTKRYQGLGMERSAAPTVCPCIFGRECTLKRKGTILAAAKKYNRPQFHKCQGKTHVAQYVSTGK